MTGATRPVGSPVDPTPAPRPGPVKLAGRYGSVVRLDARRDAGSLWQALRGDDGVWTYMSYGPFGAKSQFADWLAERETLNDPYSYAVLDRGDRTVGIVTLMSIRPDMRVIEVGNILYSPALQRTLLGTETQYLLARYVFETLGYRRYEWKCELAQRAVAPRRRALWIYLRGRLPPAHDCERSQPRHRLVLDGRQRMATAQGELRTLAGAGKF